MTAEKSQTDDAASPATGGAKSPSAETSKKQDQSDRRNIALDPRIFAYRKDLAAQSLYGWVNAPRYTAGEQRQVQRAAIALRKTPDPAASLETEALYGEHLTVYDEAGGWAWAQLKRDNYVGYLPADALSRGLHEPTHWVKSNGTFVYPKPDIKAPPVLHLSITSDVTIMDADIAIPQRFSELATGGFVLTRHLEKRGRHVRDFVEVAERLVETPYLWGGRTRVGIDCSGLVQIALKAAGIDAPRDTDLQQAYLGQSIEFNAELDRLKRGDLVYWKGHVGIMIDGVMMVHANAHHMSTVIEPLLEATARISRDSGPIAAIKRLPALTAPHTDS